MFLLINSTVYESSIVGEKIVKVGGCERGHESDPEVSEDEILLYQLLERDDEVNLWTKARRHTEGGNSC